jgi:hypothetical protein
MAVSFGGQQSGTGNERALFLKVFSGEVMNAYERAIKVSPLLTTRTITSGKSAQFPTTGLALARYFEPGESLLDGSSADSNAYLSTIKQSERVIFIDDLLTASCFIDQLDEAMSHYDYRSAFSTELGRALARHQDNYAFHTLTAAAYDIGDDAADAEHTPGDKQSVVSAANFYTESSTALDAIYAASQALDESDVPREDRVVLMPPIAYYNLLKAGVLSIGTHITSDTRKLDAGTGVQNPRGEAVNTMIAGMPVVVSNVNGFASTDDGDDAGGEAGFLDDKVPSPGNTETAGIRNLAADGAIPDGDNGDTADAYNAKTACLVFHKSAAGVVKLKDVTMESEYIIERQGTLMVAKMAQGMGALRNDAVVLIATD